jgi:hypothetical protein
MWYLFPKIVVWVSIMFCIFFNDNINGGDKQKQVQ